MKKVLIISYFFPSANFVGAERTAAWAKHLHEFGYYPIIITRNWNDNQTGLTEKVKNNDYSIEKTDQYEIRRLSYKHSLRDRLAESKRFRILQKALTLKELILSNFFISALPFSNFYAEAKKVLQEDNDIEIVIASGRPFQSFKIGHQLKKEYPNIHWIPDYRDEWTSNSRNANNGFLTKLIAKIEFKSERRWCSNATLFTTVSNVVKNNLEKHLSIKGKTIFNGFNDTIQPLKQESNDDELNIMYSGSVYTDQNFSLLFSTITKIKKNTNSVINIHFIGLGVTEEVIRQLIKKYKVKVIIKPRLPKKELFAYLSKADFLLLTPYPSTPGIYPVKLFEYYKLKTPILLVPSDKSVMEDFILKTNSGYIVSTQSECEKFISDIIQKKQRGERIELKQTNEFGDQFSRHNQTKKLAEILSKL